MVRLVQPYTLEVLNPACLNALDPRVDPRKMRETLTPLAEVVDHGWYPRMNAVILKICYMTAESTLSNLLRCPKHHHKAYTMVGDPHYMAPEQISGQGYEYSIDYWSLGILIFAMLHVETPFAKHTSETQVWKPRLKWELPAMRADVQW